MEHDKEKVDRTRFPVAGGVGVDVTIIHQQGDTQMALSNAEKVRRYRERQKEKKQQELKQPTPRSEIFKTPFFEYFTYDHQIDSQYANALELAGIHPLYMTDDTGPETSTLDDLADDTEEGGFSNPFGDSKGSSLGKAEILVALLLDSASDLANWINDYKKSEIKARLAELEDTELPDAETRRHAFAKVAELNKMLEDLDKTFRWPLPVWKPDMKFHDL
ncbi:MAG: hypothetical protein U5N10_13110 [Gemmobacter sp.]|nr:hypothetical protein [Gemmobacter sp.]